MPLLIRALNIEMIQAKETLSQSAANGDSEPKPTNTKPKLWQLLPKDISDNIVYGYILGGVDFWDFGFVILPAKHRHKNLQKH